MSVRRAPMHRSVLLTDVRGHSGLCMVARLAAGALVSLQGRLRW